MFLLNSDQLKRNVNAREHWLEIDLDDLRIFHDDLAESVLARPNDMILLLEDAAQEVATELSRITQPTDPTTAADSSNPLIQVSHVLIRY